MTTQEEPHRVSTFLIWNKAMKLSQKTWRPSLTICLWLFFLPTLISSLFLATQAHNKVLSMRVMVDQALEAKTGLSYELLTSELFGFILVFSLLGLVITTLIVWALISLTILNLEFLSDNRTMSPAEAIKKGRNVLWPRGITLIFLLLLLRLEPLVLGQLGLLSVFTVLGLMSLVLFVVERKRPTQALWGALFLKYVSKKQGMGFGVFMVALSTGIAIFLLEQSLSYLLGGLGSLDATLGLSRGFWSTPLANTPITGIFLVKQALELCFYTALLIYLPSFLLTLYSESKRRISESI